MTENWKEYKRAIICFLIAGITLLHYLPLPGWPGTHLLHRELFFFPILLAGFWFGTIGGVIAAIGVSIVYASQFAVSGIFFEVVEAIGFQVAVFVAVGLLLGWMVDRQERRRKERDLVNEAFGKYVSREVRDRILEGHIPLDGEQKQVTLLFSDLRDFTGLVERQTPQSVVRILNLYFKEMTKAIRNNGGLVLQFVGDEIEAVFGAPIPTDHHGRMALEAAMEMRSRLENLNAKLKSRGLPTLRHGIGIHTGSVLAGNIGSPDRLSYAMVGSTVNLASRIQTVNKFAGTDILVSAQTRSQLGSQFNLLEIGPVRVKGFSDPIQLFRLGEPPIDEAQSGGAASISSSKGVADQHRDDADISAELQM